jgi:hypothetical protein
MTVFQNRLRIAEVKGRRDDRGAGCAVLKLEQGRTKRELAQRPQQDCFAISQLAQRIPAGVGLSTPRLGSRVSSTTLSTPFSRF